MARLASRPAALSIPFFRARGAAGARTGARPGEDGQRAAAQAALERQMQCSRTPRGGGGQHKGNLPNRVERCAGHADLFFCHTFVEMPALARPSPVLTQRKSATRTANR
jgi:hypothetical protein